MGTRGPSWGLILAIGLCAVSCFALASAVSLAARSIIAEQASPQFTQEQIDKDIQWFRDAREPASP